MKNKTNQARVWVSLTILIMLVVGTAPAAGRAISPDDFSATPAGDNGINALWYVGEIDTPDYADDVKVVGDIAYIADRTSGLRIIDVSDPAAPTELGVFDTPNSVIAVDVVGSYAYLIENYYLYVVDVSNPESPSQVGVSATSHLNYDIALAGNYAYVGTGYPAGLSVWNISNPANPYQAGFCPTEWWGFGLALSGNYAYLATSYDGLNVIDVSNPVNPVEVGFYDVPGGIAQHVDVEGNYAYIAAFDMPLLIIDVSVPADPVEVAIYETPGDPLDVLVAWGFAYVADSNGVRVLDIADPASPFMVGSYPSTGIANGLDLDNGYIYVANGAAGLLILRDSFSITGIVTDASDNPIEGVTITATGGFTAVTDETGAYGFSDLEPGTYTLTASKDGYTFAPDSLEVTLPPNAFGQDFVGTPVTSSISGQVTEADDTPIPGVTLSFTGGYSTTTDLAGEYSLSGLPAGSYTIIPSKLGYSFTPESLEVSLPPDAIDQDFEGTPLPSSISGQVTEADDTPIPGVTLSFTGGYSTTTDLAGEYSMGGLPFGSYTIVPSKLGYSFAPESLEVTLPPDAIDQDFEGTPLPSSISGRVADPDGMPIPDVTLSFTGGYSTTTDLAGEYSLGGLPFGSYTIIPYKAGYSFTPDSLEVTLPPDAIDQDFIGDTIRQFLPITVK